MDDALLGRVGLTTRQDGERVVNRCGRLPVVLGEEPLGQHPGCFDKLRAVHQHKRVERGVRGISPSHTG